MLNPAPSDPVIVLGTALRALNQFTGRSPLSPDANPLSSLSTLRASSVVQSLIEQELVQPSLTDEQVAQLVELLPEPLQQQIAESAAFKEFRTTGRFPVEAARQPCVERAVREPLEATILATALKEGEFATLKEISPRLLPEQRASLLAQLRQRQAEAAIPSWFVAAVEERFQLARDILEAWGPDRAQFLTRVKEALSVRAPGDWCIDRVSLLLKGGECEAGSKVVLGFIVSPEASVALRVASANALREAAHTEAGTKMQEWLHGFMAQVHQRAEFVESVLPHLVFRGVDLAEVPASALCFWYRFRRAGSGLSRLEEMKLGVIAATALPPPSLVERMDSFFSDLIKRNGPYRVYGVVKQHFPMLRPCFDRAEKLG